MKYTRTDLLAAVNTVKPALAAKDLIEELTHVWFDGETMTAYNDADLGIQVPFKTDFEGGIRGSLLLGLLSNSKAKEVELAVDGDHMQLVASRTKAKLALLGAAKAVWAFPKFSTKNTFEVDPDFMAALKAVMVSVGNDTAIPEKLGVTVVAQGGVHLYATDSNTMATATAKAPKGAWLAKGDRAILPTAFCEQVLRLCDNGGFMEIADDYAVAGNGDGALVYARLVDNPHPLNLSSTIAEQTKLPKGTLFEVPGKLMGALDRALVLLEGVVGEAVTLTVLPNSKLRLDANAEGRGTLKDFMDLPATVPQLELRVDPAMVRRALPLATDMALTADAVVLTGPGGFVYLASLAGG